MLEIAMNGFCRGAWAVCVVALAGCAQSVVNQDFDSEAKPHVHTVLLAQVPNEKGDRADDYDGPASALGAVLPGSLLFTPPGLALALAMLGEHQANLDRMPAVVEAIQVRLPDDFTEMLRRGLNDHGYEARVVVLPAGNEPGKFLPFLRLQGSADAALVVELAGAVEKAGPTMVFVPRLSIHVKGYALDTGIVLYEKQFTYGYRGRFADVVYFPSDPIYRFAKVDDTLADPARVREAWLAGMRLITDQILVDLGHKP
jgi:hypothetical protein